MYTVRLDCNLFVSIYLYAKIILISMCALFDSIYLYAKVVLILTQKNVVLIIFQLSKIIKHSKYKMVNLTLY